MGWSSAARRPPSRPGVADSRPVRPRWPAMDENTADDTATRPASLGEELAGLAVADPDRPAVTFGDVTLSRAELEARTNRLARAYQALGVTPDSFVTIGLPNGIEFVEATIATWKVGATPQPISHRLPAGRAPGDHRARRSVPASSASTATTPAEGRRFPSGFEPDPRLSTAAASRRRGVAEGADVRREHRPSEADRVRQSRRARAASTGMAVLGTDARRRCRALHRSAAPQRSVPRCVRCAVHRQPRRGDAEVRRRAVADAHRAAPRRLDVRGPDDDAAHLASARRRCERYDVSSLAAVLHLAAPCPEWLKREWIDWLGPERILELYAGTEAQLATFLDGTEWLAHPGSVGRPLCGELQIRDVDGNVLPARGGRLGVDARTGRGAVDVPLRRCDREGGRRRVGVARRRRPPRRGRLPLPRRPATPT